jgi:hypothetical protein
MKCKESNFLKNVFYALGAQVISLTASILVSFIVPKLIDVSNYAFWQLFLFYVTYINISRLGYIDGLYLRLGGKKYDELDHNKLKENIVEDLYILFVKCTNNEPSQRPSIQQVIDDLNNIYI